MRRIAFLLGAGAIAASLAFGQEYSRFTFSASGGLTSPVGNTGRFLDNGWNVGVAGGINFSSRIAAMLRFQYNDLGIQGETLGSLGAHGGTQSISSFTLDPRVHFRPGRAVDFYVSGGGGLYTRHQGFDPPFVATSTPGNSFFGFAPVTSSAPGLTVIVPSATLSKPGFNIGAGLEFGGAWHGKFFAEARWNHMFISDVHEDYIPISFGFRF